MIRPRLPAIRPGDDGQVAGFATAIVASPRPEAASGIFPSSGRSARTAGRRWCRRSRSCSTSRSAGRHCRCAGGRSDSRRRRGRGSRCWREAATKSSCSISRRIDRLVRAGGALAVAGQRLGRADGRQLVAEYRADRVQLGDVADRRRGAMGVDVVDRRIAPGRPGSRRSRASCSAPRLRPRARPCRRRRRWRRSRSPRRRSWRRARGRCSRSSSTSMPPPPEMTKPSRSLS